MGSCWDDLKKARNEISSCKEALASMDLAEGADLVQRVKENLFQYQEAQVEGLVRYLISVVIALL